MPEGYKRSWGSVSKNFSPSRGFTSETKRMSKEAEDVYKKAQAQLKTKQEVYNLQTAQAKVTANTDASTSKYEMAALSNFSKSLKTFLTTTVKDMAVENEKKDLAKWREKWKTHDADTIEEREKIEATIASISDNTAEVARLQEKLKELKLFDELNPVEMSGNEQFAYYAHKADNLVKNSEVGFFGFKEEQADNLIPATWKGTYFNSATGKNEYEQIRIGDIHDPRGHQVVKEMYLNKVIDDNPMGGLNAKLRTHILIDPLDTKLEGIVDKNREQFVKDITVNKGAANDLAFTNRLLGTPGYEPIELVTSEIDALLTFNGNNATTLGYHTGRAGVVKGIEGTLYTTLINNTRTLGDLDKLGDRIKYTLTEAKIKNGPNKGKTLLEAHGSVFNDDKELTRLTKNLAKRAKLIKTEQEDTEVGSFTMSLDSGINQIASDHTSRQNEDMSQADSAVIAEEEKDKLFNDALKSAKTTAGKTYIFSMMSDTRLLFTDDQWMDHARDLGEKWNGVIPEQELIRMPDHIREELKKFDIRIEENVPGGSNEAEVKLTGANVKYLQNQIKGVEKTLTGNTLGNADSGVMADLANDWYHKRLQYYMLIADPPHSHNVAAQHAREEVSAMITSGGQNQEFVTEGPMKGMKNPFWAQNPSTTNSNNPWEANPATDAHRKSGLRLLTLPERHYQSIENAVQSQSDNPGGLDLNNSWIFAPLNKEAIANGDLTGLEHLGIQVDNTRTSAQNHIVMEALTKLGIKATGENAGGFVAKQRSAAIISTGGLKSPLLQNETLMKAWFGGDPVALKEQLRVQEIKAKEKANKERFERARTNPWYNMYSWGGLL